MADIKYNFIRYFKRYKFDNINPYNDYFIKYKIIDTKIILIDLTENFNNSNKKFINSIINNNYLLGKVEFRDNYDYMVFSIIIDKRINNISFSISKEIKDYIYNKYNSRIYRKYIEEIYKLSDSINIVIIE